MKAASTAMIVLGLVLIGTSLVWPKIAPKPAPMSEEKEQQFQKAAGDMHNAAPTVTEESKALVKEFAESNRKAARFEELGTRILKFGGILLTCIGVGVYFVAARSDG